jgi:hypothetical protein
MALRDPRVDNALAKADAAKDKDMGTNAQIAHHPFESAGVS